MRDELFEEIVSLGDDILSSKRFAKAYDVPHHSRSGNIALHSMETAGYALLIAQWLGEHGLTVSCEDVVRASLLHDIGMTDDDVFNSPSYRKAHTHPRRGAYIARTEFGANETQLEAIAHHMFPVRSMPPRTIEGWVVSLADKCCSVREVGRSTEGLVERAGQRILRWYRKTTH